MRIDDPSTRLEQAVSQMNQANNDLSEALKVLDLCISDIMSCLPSDSIAETSLAAFLHQTQKEINDARSLGPRLAAISDVVHQILNTFIPCDFSSSDLFSDSSK